MALYTTPNPNSLRALAYEISNTYYGGITSDDAKFSLRQIESEIVRQYGKVVKMYADRDLMMGLRLDVAMEVSYPCLKINNSTDFYCKCSDTGGSFKEVAIPKFLNYFGTPYITYFGNTDLDVPFTYVSSISQANTQLSNQKVGSGKLKPMYMLSGTKAYVVLPKDYAMMCDVTIIGIPENPSTSSSVNDCYGIWYNNWNVPQYMKADIKDLVIQKLALPISQFIPNQDNRNNNNDGNQLANDFKQSNQI